jgi:hypothetical protein
MQQEKWSKGSPTLQQEYSTKNRKKMFNSLPPISQPAATPLPVATSPKALKEKSTILMLTIGCIGCSALSAVLSIAVLASLASTKKEVMHSYVVDQVGNRLALHQITDPTEQAQHIQNFAVWFVNGLHSYQWYIDGEKGEKVPDPGLKVTGGKTIPSAIYLATLAMRPELAVHYRTNIADVLSEKRMTEKEHSYFKPAVNGVSLPQKIGTDLWKVYVKGIQVSVAESGKERWEERYVVLKIGRIIPISLSIAQRDYKDKEIAKAVAETSAAGLQIEAIEDLASKYPVTQPTTTKGAK